MAKPSPKDAPPPADSDVVARLDGKTPGEGETDAPLQVLERYEVDATCAPVAGRPGSTTGGMRGGVQFELSVVDAGPIFLHLGQRAYSLTFDGVDLGDRYTVSGVRGRPDSHGAARAFVDFIAPEAATLRLGLLFEREMIGRKGRLVLDSTAVPKGQVKGQVGMDDLLNRDDGEDTDGN